MNIYQNAGELVGNTPLLHLNGFKRAENIFGKIYADIYAKLEFRNPAGSVKDRIANYMLKDAEARGVLKPDSVIIESSSGNTGIGIAAAGCLAGYRVIITMPETMSPERVTILKAYGAEVVLTEGKLGMKGAIDKAQELNRTIKNSVILGQFTNPANPETHYKTTGPELYDALDGKVDIFVATVGTGGTISGTGEFLKSKNSATHIIAVEPADSPLLSAGKAAPHGIQGIGPNFVPDTLNRNIYDGIITVTTADAYSTARAFAKYEGLLCGISSGAALWAALTLANDPAAAGKNIAVILPDGGDRYFSTPLYDKP